MAARDPDSSQRRLGEGDLAASQSTHRELARQPIPPSGVPFIVLPPEKYGILT